MGDVCVVCDVWCVLCDVWCVLCGVQCVLSCVVFCCVYLVFIMFLLFGCLLVVIVPSFRRSLRLSVRERSRHVLLGPAADL